MLKHRSGILITALALLLVAAVLLSFFTGRYSVSLLDMWKSITVTHTVNDSAYNAMIVVLKVRLPRILAAVLVGGALGLSGAAFQGVFGNPIVSPDLLGSSSGAGLGACIAIMLHFGAVKIQFAALAGGLLATWITCFISRLLMKRKSGIIVYILVGLMVSALFEAGVSIAKYIADPFSDLQTMTYWLMGSLSAVTLSQIAVIILPVAVGTAILLWSSYKVNLLSFSDEEALSMGVNVRAFRLLIIVAATLLCSASVAIAGIIGWVGLVVPHIARIFVGPDNKKLLPAAFLTGGIYLLVIDDIARALLTLELPLSVLTGAIGAPVFIFLLMKGRSGWK